MQVSHSILFSTVVQISQSLILLQGSSFWKTKPVISYFLTEFPDAKSRKLFASAQLDIWAVEGL